MTDKKQDPPPPKDGQKNRGPKSSTDAPNFLQKNKSLNNYPQEAVAKVSQAVSLSEARRLGVGAGLTPREASNLFRSLNRRYKIEEVEKIGFAVWLDTKRQIQTYVEGRVSKLEELMRAYDPQEMRYLEMRATVKELKSLRNYIRNVMLWKVEGWQEERSEEERSEEERSEGGCNE